MPDGRWWCADFLKRDGTLGMALTFCSNAVTDLATGTSYLFTNTDGTLIVHVAPPGPIRFSEDEAWFEHRTLPASVLETIREEARGAKLSSRSRQGEPVRAIQSTPSSTRRW